MRSPFTKATATTALLALLGASGNLLLAVSAAPVAMPNDISGTNANNNHLHQHRGNDNGGRRAAAASPIPPTFVAVARRQAPATTRPIPTMMPIPTAPTSVAAVAPSAAPVVVAPAPPPMVEANNGAAAGGVAGSNPTMTTGLPVLGGGAPAVSSTRPAPTATKSAGKDAVVDGGEQPLLTATATATATPPAAAAPTKTKGAVGAGAAEAHVTAEPAVTVVATMRCTEANLLKCTINEWRDAEVCFVELCL